MQKISKSELNKYDMERQYMIVLLLALITSGCAERHRLTIDLGNHLYSEIFDFNPAGVDKAYLTDSASFRVYIGEFDTEHERFSYQIKEDTIQIFKTKAGDGGMRVLMGQKELSLEYLKKNKINSTEPLFKFQ